MSNDNGYHGDRAHSGVSYRWTRLGYHAADGDSVGRWHGNSADYAVYCAMRVLLGAGAKVETESDP